MLKSYGKLNNSLFPSKDIIMQTKKTYHMSVDEAVAHLEGHTLSMAVLIGLPGSGKSTLTSKLTSYIVASTDDLIEREATTAGLTYTQIFTKVDRKLIEKEYKEVIREAVENKRKFVVDRTNISAASRRTHLVNTTSDFVKIAVVFLIPPDVLDERLKVRGEKTGKWIPRSVVESMQKDYEFPTHEEGFDEIIYIV